MPDYPGRQFFNRRPAIAQGKLCACGDSFATMRRTGGTNDVNGRFNNTSGWNFLDWFRFSFPYPLVMDLTTNFAREGAYASRDWSPAPAWSAINPIPSLASQITQLIAANPVGSITEWDVVVIALGTNDGINPDGGTKPTDVQVETAIVTGINRLITHGFKQIFYVYPESKWQPTLPGLLQPDINTLQANNRGIRFITAYWDSATLEQANPYLDGTHPNEAAGVRMGQIMSMAYQSGEVVDRTQSFQLSARRSSVANPIRLGITNYDPNNSRCITSFADDNNAVITQTNLRMTMRSYNGLVLKAASEANAFTPPVGAGKNDPCLTIAGEFWEHQALLLLDNVASSPAPMILGRLGGVDRFKVGSDGGVTIAGTGQFKIDNPVRFAASRTTPLTISYPTAGVWTILSYATVNEDPYNQYSNTTFKYTPSQSGFYIFNVGAGINPPVSPTTNPIATIQSRRFILALFKNGSEIARIGDQTPLVSTAQVAIFTQMIGSTFLQVNANDVFDVRLYSAVAGDIALTGELAVTFFRAVKIF